MPSKKLAALEDKLTQAKATVAALAAEKTRVEAELRAEANKVIAKHADVLLAFAAHAFRDCEESRPYKSPNCPRCRLLSLKDGDTLPDSAEFTVTISFRDHDSSED